MKVDKPQTFLGTSKITECLDSITIAANIPHSIPYLQVKRSQIKDKYKTCMISQIHYCREISEKLIPLTCASTIQKSRI